MAIPAIPPSALTSAAIDRAGGDPTARATAFALNGKQFPTIPVVAETVPTVAVGTNKYYLDPISGNDAASGTTPATPWATLAKLNQLNPGAGARIYLAADGVFDTALTLTDYRTNASFPFNCSDNLRGTSALPIYIEPYYPRRTVSTSRPILRYYATIAASDWTQETGIGPNIWSFAFTASATAGDNEVRNWIAFGASISTAKLGVAARQGVAGQPIGNTPQQLAKDMDFAVAQTKTYVYAPSNPTTYYGGVFFVARAIFNSAWQGGHYLKLRRLRFEMARAVNFDFASNTGNGHQGFEVFQCEFDRAHLGYLNNQQKNASPAEMTLSFHDNAFTNTPGSAIHIGNGNSGTTGNTVSWRVYRNTVRSGNLCSAHGGALLYNQSIGGTDHIAFSNYGYDCRNGAGGNNIDGSFIYMDAGCTNAVITRNTAERCAVPYQINNSKNVVNVGNLSIDCLCHAVVTGANDVNIANQSCIVAHNTWLWTGRVAASDIPRGPGGPTFSGPVVNFFNDGFDAFGNKFTSLVIANNAAISSDPQTEVVGKSFVRYRTNQVTTLLIAGNACAGFDPVLSVDIIASTATDTTSSAGFFSVIGTVADAPAWTVGAATGGARPDITSPIAGSGAPLSTVYQDMLGSNFNVRPTIGCFEVRPPV